VSDPAAPSSPTDAPAEPVGEQAPAGPFARLADFVALPRLSGLALSSDGSRLVTTVATLDADGTAWQSSLWELDPAGGRPPRRLTRGPAGESNPVFTPAGDLLFTSARPDPDAGKDAGEPKPALWSLPPDGGEARLVAQRPAGIAGIAVAADTGEVAVVAGTMPGAADADADEERRKRRKDAGVTAVLHESYPVRQWDHDLGPAVPHVFWLGRLPAESPPGAAAETVEWRDLTPDAGPPTGSGDDLAVSPDGRLLVRAEEVPDGPAGRRSRLVVTEVATGATRVLVDDPLADLGSPAFSPTARRWSAVASRPPATPSRRTTPCSWSTRPPARPGS